MVNHQSVMQFTNNIVTNWVHSGRFFPLAFYSYILFAFVRNLLIYKIILLLLTIIDCLLFVYLIFVLTSNKTLALIILLTLPMLFTFHPPHDPILSFHGLLQNTLFLVLISLLFLIKYLNGKNKIFILLSLIMYCLSLMMYEITYVFFLLHVAIIWHDYKLNNKNFKNFILSSLPYLGSALFFITLSIFLRNIYNVPLVGESTPYIININIIPILSTYLKQIVNTLPLSYVAFDPDGILFGLRGFLVLRLFLLLIPSLFLFVIGFWLARIKKETSDQYKMPIC